MYVEKINTFVIMICNDTLILYNYMHSKQHIIKAFSLTSKVYFTLPRVDDQLFPAHKMFITLNFISRPSDHRLQSCIVSVMRNFLSSNPAIQVIYSTYVLKNIYTDIFLQPQDMSVPCSVPSHLPHTIALQLFHNLDYVMEKREVLSDDHLLIKIVYQDPKIMDFSSVYFDLSGRMHRHDPENGTGKINKIRLLYCGHHTTFPSKRQIKLPDFVTETGTYSINKLLVHSHNTEIHHLKDNLEYYHLHKHTNTIPDEVINSAAEVLLEYIRTNDVACYLGKEFCIEHSLRVIKFITQNNKMRLYLDSKNVVDLLKHNELSVFEKHLSHHCSHDMKDLYLSSSGEIPNATPLLSTLHYTRFFSATFVLMPLMSHGDVHVLRNYGHYVSKDRQTQEMILTLEYGGAYDFFITFPDNSMAKTCCKYNDSYIKDILHNHLYKGKSNTIFLSPSISCADALHYLSNVRYYMSSIRKIRHLNAWLLYAFDLHMSYTQHNDKMILEVRTLLPAWIENILKVSNNMFKPDIRDIRVKENIHLIQHTFSHLKDIWQNLADTDKVDCTMTNVKKAVLKTWERKELYYYDFLQTILVITSTNNPALIYDYFVLKDYEYLTDCYRSIMVRRDALIDNLFTTLVDNQQGNQQWKDDTTSILCKHIDCASVLDEVNTQLSTSVTDSKVLEQYMQEIFSHFPQNILDKCSCYNTSYSPSISNVI